MAVTRAPLTQTQRGTARRAVVDLSGTILVGAAGAVTSVQCEEAPNITGTVGSIIKNAAAGRYDVTFLKKFKNIRFTGGNIIHSGTGAFTGATGVLGRPGLVTNQSIEIQCTATTTDTDVTSGYTIVFTAEGQEF